MMPTVMNGPITATTGKATNPKRMMDVFHMRLTPVGAFKAALTNGLCPWTMAC